MADYTTAYYYCTTHEGKQLSLTVLYDGTGCDVDVCSTMYTTGTTEFLRRNGTSSRRVAAMASVEVTQREYDKWVTRERDHKHRRNTENSAYVDGYTAANQELPDTVCPYPKLHKLREHWLAGYSAHSTED